MSDLQRVLLLIVIAGAVGGVINALTSDNGFALPQTESTTGGGKILRPGFLGNVLLGALAAVLLFALYGPLQNVVLVGERAGDRDDQPAASLSLSALAGAALTGVGGARLITSEVDKRLLKAAAAEAAGSPPNAASGAQMAAATPASALEIAKAM